MTLTTLDIMSSKLPASSRLMGIDPGSKKIGLALSDITRMIASPSHTIRRKKFSGVVTTLTALVITENIGGIIIGLPLNMNGSIGPSAQSATQFAENLSSQMDIPVGLWDERLSTAAVERSLIEADLSRHRRSELVDKLSATYILQGALDYLASNA